MDFQVQGLKKEAYMCGVLVKGYGWKGKVYV